MTLDVNLKDRDSANSFRVTDEKAVVVTLSNDIPVSEEVLNVPLSRFMTIGGAVTGVSSLKVNGSVDPVEAYVGSDVNGEVYLTTMNIVIADSAVRLDRFGNLPALTNGVQVFYDITRGRSVVPLPFKTAFDFLRSSNLTAGTGGKIDAFQMQNVGVTSSDAYSFNVDLTKFSPLGFGIRLRKSGTDKFGVRIRDNLTGMADFSILVSGYLRLVD